MERLLFVPVVTIGVVFSMLRVLMSREGGHNTAKKMEEVLQSAWQSSIFVNDPSELGSSIEAAKQARMGLALHLPERDLHPVDQVKVVREIFEAVLQGVDFALSTNSLFVIYALNNEVLKNGWKDVEVQVLGKAPRPTKDGWIDESIIGWVSEELNTEMNRNLVKNLPIWSKQ